MDKQELLNELAAAQQQGIVSREEVLAVFDRQPAAETDINLRKLTVSNILYSIGGAIVVLGVSIFVYQNWDLLNSFTRILVTLGTGIAAYIVGVALTRQEKYQEVSLAFFLISAIMMPIGMGVTLYEANFDTSSTGIQSLIAGSMTLVYLASFWAFRSSLFVFFEIIFGTWFYYVFTSFLVQANPIFVDNKWFEYRTFVAGLSYMLLGYYFTKSKYAGLTTWLNTVGVVSFLGAALALGGWSPGASAFWEIIFPGLVFGVIFLSIHIKSRAYLTFGSIFLMIYILKITGEYFSTSFGWPVSLIIAGLALIVVGYFTVVLNKKYIR